MKRPPPSNETVEAAFPGITNASLFDTGGFKAVYSVEILGRKEALELVEIPELNDPHEADIFRAEVTSRVRWLRRMRTAAAPKEEPQSVHPVAV